jgi:hypothetical protein
LLSIDDRYYHQPEHWKCKGWHITLLFLDNSQHSAYWDTMDFDPPL